MPQIWYFALKLRVIFGRNDTCLIIRCLYMLSEADVRFFIHLMKVMKHSSSNGCLSLQRSITFPVWRGCPESDILHENWELFLVEMTHGWPQGACIYPVWSSCEHPYTSKEGYETLKQQWMSLFTAHHHISSAERVPIIWYFAWSKSKSFSWQKWHRMDHKVPICCVKIL